MFADLDDTIRQLLINHAIDTSEVDVSFDAPDREWSGRLSRPTVNLFLYDVRENKELRETAWDVTRDADNGTVTRRLLPVRINATYNVTVWARAPEDEHRLLWRVLSALARFPILADPFAEHANGSDPGSRDPKDFAQGALKQQPYPVLAKVGQPDQVRTNAADLWQAVDNRIRPSLTYVVTLALDPEVVFEKEMTFTLERHARQLEDGGGGVDRLIQISGRVRDRKDASLIRDARVRWRERGIETVTGADGGFVFRRVPEGKLTLVVQAPGRREVSRPTIVPSQNYDVEV